jgi:hypothetical protein
MSTHWDLTGGPDGRGVFDDLYFRDTETLGLLDVVEPDQDDFIAVIPLMDQEGMPRGKGPRTYVKTFKVLTKNRFHGPIAVCKAVGLPWPYAPYLSNDGYEIDPAALAVNISAKREFPDDFQSWIVTVNYSTEMPENGPDFFLDWPTEFGPQNAPWLERPTIRIDAEEIMVAEPFDLNGNPYVSSATQPFYPAPMFPVLHPVMVVVRNMENFTPDIAVEFANSVNDTTIFGQPPETVQCEKPTGELMYRGKIAYWRTTWRARIKTRTVPDPDNPVSMIRETWQPWFLDQGTFRIQNAPFVPLFGEPVPITKNGQPVTQPVPLDGLGQQLRPDPVTGLLVPVYRQFRRFPRVDLRRIFSNLAP